MVKPIVRHTAQLRRTQLVLMAVTVALLVVVIILTLAGCNKRTPPNSTVHNGQVAPMATSSPDNCSSCHS